ncbi:unnamed protein product, partial [Rotaria magnacalcarata]
MFHRCIDKGLKFLRSEWLIRSIVEYRMANIVQYHCDPFDTIDRRALLSVLPSFSSSSSSSSSSSPFSLFVVIPKYGNAAASACVEA